MTTILVDQTPETVVSTSINSILVTNYATNVVVSSDTSNVIAYTQEQYTPISIGIQGPQGIKGDTGATGAIGPHGGAFALSEIAPYIAPAIQAVIGVEQVNILAVYLLSV